MEVEPRQHLVGGGSLVVEVQEEVQVQELLIQVVLVEVEQVMLVLHQTRLVLPILVEEVEVMLVEVVLQ